MRELLLTLLIPDTIPLRGLPAASGQRRQNICLARREREVEEMVQRLPSCHLLVGPLRRGGQKFVSLVVELVAKNVERRHC